MAGNPHVTELLEEMLEAGQAERWAAADLAPISAFHEMTIPRAARHQRRSVRRG